jgi:hypothetical protein
LEQWTDSIGAVLDDLGSTEAVLIAQGRTPCVGGAHAVTQGHLRVLQRRFDLHVGVVVDQEIHARRAATMPGIL